MNPDSTSGDTPPTAGGDVRDPRHTPRDLKLNLSAQELVVEWQDGHRSRYVLGQLRRQCPCATCRRDRAAPSTHLPILKHSASGPLTVRDAELLGHYAIQLKWSDGHDTGIYDWRYLRSLDPSEGQAGPDSAATRSS